MQSEFVRRKSDWCENQDDFLKGSDTPEQLENLSHWISLARVHYPNGQEYAVVKHACRDSCAANILSNGMLNLPQEVIDAAKGANA